MTSLVLRFGLLLTLSSASVWAEEVGTSCRTPLGVPCHTLHYRIDDWLFFRTGTLRVEHFADERLEAVRQDGSHAFQGHAENSTWFGLPVRHDSAWFYLSSQNRFFFLDPAQQTYTRHPPPIGPHRQAQEGDATCRTGIVHWGTDLQQGGTETILGLTTVHWRRSLADGGQEDIYLAPALDCAPLKQKAVHQNALHIPTFILSTEATRVDWGEPAADLFVVPAGYREVAAPPLKKRNSAGEIVTTATPKQ